MRETTSKKALARMRGGLLRAAFTVLALMLPSSCSSQGTYLDSTVGSPVQLQASAFHDFELVRAYADDGELVVYGRVRHTHGPCAPPAHVDLAILDAQQNPVVKQSLPLVRRSQRNRGWFGAAFRTRIPGHPQPGETIRLAFHDDGCVPTTQYDCGSNVAVTLQDPAPRTGAQPGARPPRAFPN